MKVRIPIKTIRRLFAAEGYLELGMPDHALDQLSEIEHAQPVEATIQFLTGEAYKAQERYTDAIEPLQRAAQLIPAPYNKIAWLSLSDCFRKSGQDALADAVEMFANTPEVPAELEAELQAESDAEDGLFLEDSDDEEFGVDDVPPWHGRWT